MNRIAVGLKHMFRPADAPGATGSVPGADDHTRVERGHTVLDDADLLLSEAYSEGTVTEIIRPAAIVPEEAARSILVELAMRDVRNGGMWQSKPSLWSRWDRTWNGASNVTGAELIGSIEVAYGTPSRYEITIYRVTVTKLGAENGWTVTTLCDEALALGGLTLAACPRANLRPAPPVVRI